MHKKSMYQNMRSADQMQDAQMQAQIGALSDADIQRMGMMSERGRMSDADMARGNVSLDAAKAQAEAELAAAMQGRTDSRGSAMIDQNAMGIAGVNPAMPRGR